MAKPFLALELDAKKAAVKVARACGVSPGDVLWGLAEAWEYVWTTKRDVLAPIVVTGCFGPQITILALVEFGFLETVEGGYRVKGAERLLRVRRAQSEAGKKHAANLIPGGPNNPRLTPAKPSTKETGARVSLGSTLGSPGRVASALTPNTQHPIKETTTHAPRKRDAPDARWQPTVKALEQAFRETTGQTYRFQGSTDGKALKRLLASQSPEEILRRWRVGLQRTGWHNTATIAQLDHKWNDLAGPAPPTKPGAPIDPLTQGHRTEGPITATEVQL